MKDLGILIFSIAVIGVTQTQLIAKGGHDGDGQLVEEADHAPWQHGSHRLPKEAAHDHLIVKTGNDPSVEDAGRVCVREGCLDTSFLYLAPDQVWYILKGVSKHNLRRVLWMTVFFYAIFWTFLFFKLLYE
jgi:hypothetical protein